MNEGEISNYLEYWMDKDKGFSDILNSAEYVVEDVEHHDHEGFPRSAVILNHNLVLLFPPFQVGFNYI